MRENNPSRSGVVGGAERRPPRSGDEDFFRSVQDPVPVVGRGVPLPDYSTHRIALGVDAVEDIRMAFLDLLQHPLELLSLSPLCLHTAQ